MKNYIITPWVCMLLPCLIVSNFMYGQCNTANYSTNEKDSWLSCEKSLNPNSRRGNSHWLQYDLGYVYKLGSSKFWNYNGTNLTGRGFKQVAIDYSSDGIRWTEAGTFQLPEANGETNYEGVAGLDLSEISARYILITALTNWDGGSCAGLSEVKFNVTTPNSICGDYLVTQNIVGDPIDAGTYYGENPITSNGKIKEATTVTFKSATAITLTQGFYAEAGSDFFAKIENCNALKTPNEQEKPTRQISIRSETYQDIKIYPNPATNLINLDLGEIEITDLMIINMSGHEILRRSIGQNFHQIDVSQFSSGMYMINVLTVNQEFISKRFIKTSL